VVGVHDLMGWGIPVANKKKTGKKRKKKAYSWNGKYLLPAEFDSWCCLSANLGAFNPKLANVG